MKKILLFWAIVLLVLAFRPGPANGSETWKEVRLDDEVVLIRPAAEPALRGRVFAAEGRTTLIRAAADLGEAGSAAVADLERYLPLACGGRVLASGEADSPHDYAILLATRRSVEFLSRAGVDKELPALGEQECLILPVEAFPDGRPGVVLVGGNPRGLLNGVYTLLEKAAGIFWETGRILERRGEAPSHGPETIVGHREELSWRQGRLAWKPAVSDRVLYIGYAPDLGPAVDWASRNRFSHLVISTPRTFPLSEAEDKSLKTAVDRAHTLGIKALFLNMTHRLPASLGALKPSSPEAIQASTDLFAGLVSRFGLDGFAWHSASEGIEIAADPEYQKLPRAQWEARYFNSYYSAIRKIRPDAMLVMLLGWVYMNPAAEMKRLFPADTVAWIVPNTPIIDAALTDIPGYGDNFKRIWYWLYVTVSRDGAFPMVKLDYLEKHFAEALQRGHSLAPQGVFGVNTFNAMYFAQVARDGLIPHEEFLKSFGERYYGDAGMGEALLDYQKALVFHRNWYNNVHTSDVKNYFSMEESWLLKRAFETTAAAAESAKTPLLKDRLKVMAVTILRCFVRRCPHLNPPADPAKSWTMDYMKDFAWNRQGVEALFKRYEEVFATTEPAAPGDFFGEEFLKIKSVLQSGRAASSTVPAASGQPGNPNTDWFHQAGWGVFVHYLADLQNNPAELNSLGRASSWDECVREFDVDRFAGQVGETGAGYVIFTMHQRTRFLIAPNATFDRLTGYQPGEACATRDLVEDLYRALSRRGIRLMLYFTGDGPRQDKRAARALGWTEKETVEYVRKWASVAREYSERYGAKVAGWWVDGCYPWIGYDDARLEIMAEALKSGNPKAIIALNVGVQDRVRAYTKWEDFTCGEQNEFRDIPEGRWANGEQWHILSFLGCSHQGWAVPGSKYKKQELAEYVRKVNKRGGVVSIDVMLYRDGELDRSQLEMLKTLRLKPDAGL